ncbi:MAG: glycosyltransferase [Bacteroidales bacterium]|nr:glycosyltransferase [Bacteroidales bacterium]
MFSVLIANYNNGLYLQEAIDSVFAQTYTDWEIVIVDDGSTDDSQKIYEKYIGNERIHIFYNERNRGCTYTKWSLIEECNGEWFGFLDADDTLMPEALECMVKSHQDNPDAAIVSSRHYQCDENMNVRYESRLLKIPIGGSYLTNRDFQPEAFISFKKSFYQKTQGLNKNNAYGDDQELLLLMEEVGQWVVLDKFLYKYRISEKSVSHGEDNYICLYWNIVVYHQACIRRGLDPEKYSYKVFQDFIKYNREKVIGSKEYRVGNAILHPWKFIKWHTRWINRLLNIFKENLQRFRYHYLPYKFNINRFKDTFLSHDSGIDDSASLSKPVNRVIYCFWTGTNKMSENRKRCFETIVHNAGVPVKLITPDNLSEYILPEHPLHPAFPYLSLVHKADYLRCYFMHFYGGGYCDIKNINRDWNDSFDRLDKSYKYILGYPEPNAECSAYVDIIEPELKRDLKKCWPLLIGNCAYICHQQTKFTEEWYNELRNRLDFFYETLKKHPATDPMGQENGYPIPWQRILGAIFHPLCLKYHNKIIQDKKIMPSFNNYR